MFYGATFLTVTAHQLNLAGIEKGHLAFKSTELASGFDANALREIHDLRTRLVKIYDHVSMDGAGLRMVFEAILIALAVKGPEDGVAIVPGLNLGQDEPMRIANPTSEYELWLSGKVDYAVMMYKTDEDNKDSLVGPGGARETSIDLAQGCLFLVEPKHLNLQYGLDDSIPEAVSQAIALLKLAQFTPIDSEVRFCLTNGQYWKFLLLRSENGVLKYYESGLRSLDKDLASSDKELRKIMALVCEWLKPTCTDHLFSLR
ncbi:hypothetical protein VNI00_010813 [Paramarasmius palmivorus]|uniref:Uncharacterized protein n=1 Tax=Paramarasmius palmivorus TaxID=297713 RepID=A0AAW0CHL5_9AGAR